MEATTSAIASIAGERADQAREYTPRTDKRPSGKQIYYAARLAFELLGLDWPTSSAEASAIIGRLQELKQSADAVTRGDSVPF